MSNFPTLGRVVYFRSRTGNYTLSAEIIGTQESVAPRGIELGHVPALVSPFHVHLLVRSPAIGGPMRSEADDFIDGSDAYVEDPVNGLYREWNVGPSALVLPDGVELPNDAEFDEAKPDWRAISYGEHWSGDEIDAPATFAPRSWAWPRRSGS